MPRFAPNLSLLWPELDPLGRVAAAAAAGFRFVEMQFVHDLDSHRLKEALVRHDVELVLFDIPPGDWAGGERGLLCLPGRESDFADSLRLALSLAELLGTRKVTALAGLAVDGISPATRMSTAVANLVRGGELALRYGVEILVEAINRADVPDYFLPRLSEAAELVELVGLPNVRLQFDQYHVSMSGADPLTELTAHFHLVGHVQVADVPGRHEPGTGTAPIRELCGQLDALGYTGYVGLEYVPSNGTANSLLWTRGLQLSSA